MNASHAHPVISVLCVPSKCSNIYYWVDMAAYMKWWAQGCLQRKVCITYQQPVRWSVSIFIRSSPSVTVGVDYFSPISTTARGNSYTPVFTNKFSRILARENRILASFQVFAMLLNKKEPRSRVGYGSIGRVEDSNDIRLLSA